MKQKLNLFILFLILFIGQVNYVKADTTIASGIIDGTSIWWRLTSPNGAQENMKLTLTGSGQIPSFESDPCPWGNYSPKITDIYIPSTITRIGIAAFYRTAISSINIPSTCTAIDTWAFVNCSNLKEITIPSSCRYLGAEVFEGCTSLKKVNIASDTEIRDFAFSKCTSLEEINIPYCTKIGVNAFENCTSLKEINIPSSVVSIDKQAFSRCTNLKEIYIPSSVVSIGGQAFYGCTNLSRICFEGRCTANMTNAFTFENVAAKGVFYEKSGSGTSYARVPSGWTYYTHDGITRSYVADGTLYVSGNAAYTTEVYYAGWYSQRSSIKKIVVEEGVTDIGDYAFRGCTNVTEVTLNNKGGIGRYAFNNCTALTRVNIGTGLTGFYPYSSDYPFSGCSKLSEVNVSSVASLLKIENLIYLTDSFYGTAKEKTLMVNGVTHDSSSELVILIPEEVSKTPGVAFSYFKNVTKIKIPSTVTDIPQYCFASNTYLKQVTLNNTGIVGAGAFKNCTALTRVNIGTGLTEFNPKTDNFKMDHPFSGCSKLSEVNVSSLASFNEIVGLMYLTDNYYGTAREKTLMINGVTHDSSSELVIPEGVTMLHNSFGCFKNVTKIKLPSTMTKIRYGEFYDYTYLTKIVLPSSITSIEGYAFWGCGALTTITLPSSVTSVGEYAFYLCSKLERIICKATTPPVATGSIATNPSNISLKVPTGKTATYKAANGWKELSIDEGRTFNYNVAIRANESMQITNDLLNEQKIKSISETNSSVATSTVSSDIITIKSGTIPTYDGTTTNPYKSAVLRLYLEEDDQLVYNIDVYPREVELTDGNAYKNTKEFEVDKVSYTRSFSEKIIGKWQCFYAPFDIEITEELLEDFDFAKLYMVSYKDENDNGEIEDGEPLKMMLNKLSAGKILHANKPYFVKTKSACTKTFVATNAVLKAAARGSVRCCTTEHEYSLVGIYNPTNIKGFYTMGTSGGFSYYTTDKTINQYRWYMEIKSLTEDGGEYENYARPIEIFVEGEDETTGIIALENKVSDSQNDKIYTLDGRLVTDFETLPGGIYIVNGKKVFKK